MSWTHRHHDNAMPINEVNLLWKRRKVLIHLRPSTLELLFLPYRTRQDDRKEKVCEDSRLEDESEWLVWARGWVRQKEQIISLRNFKGHFLDSWMASAIISHILCETWKTRLKNSPLDFKYTLIAWWDVKPLRSHIALSLRCGSFFSVCEDRRKPLDVVYSTSTYHISQDRIHVWLFITHSKPGKREEWYSSSSKCQEILDITFFSLSTIHPPPLERTINLISKKRRKVDMERFLFSTRTTLHSRSAAPCAVVYSISLEELTTTRMWRDWNAHPSETEQRSNVVEGERGASGKKWIKIWNFNFILQPSYT